MIGTGRASANSPRWGAFTGAGRSFAPGPETSASRAASSGPVSSGAEELGLVPGDSVVHARFGQGVVLEVQGAGDEARATICFPTHGEKRFLLALSPLERATPVAGEPTDQ